MRKKWLLVAAPLVALAVLFSGLPTLAHEDTDDTGGIRPPALVIRAPHAVPPNEEMTLAVLDRASREPVADAGVWALPLGDPEALRTEIAALREAAGDSDIDWQSFLDDRASFLGATDEESQVSATIVEEGRYLLVAFKPGYRPGLRRLLVGTRPLALVIRAPRVALPGEEITIGVFDRASKEPVAAAGVWAIARENGGRIRSGLASLREPGNAATTLEEFQSLVGDAAYLGETDPDGRRLHTFADAGGYFLVAFKPGSRAAFTPINVRPESGNLDRRPTANGDRPRLKVDNSLLRAAEPTRLRMCGRARGLTLAPPRR